MTHRALAALCLATLGPALAACGKGATAPGAAAGAAGATRTGNPAGGGARGSVAVLYAGSLVNMMEGDLGPAFARATGYAYEGFAAGSTQLVAQIKGGIRRGDVFISASPVADSDLEGRGNGGYVSWYVTFAKAPLVLGYNRASSFAAQLRSKPWYRVITQPGIRVGRTDPKLDPKGKLTVSAVDEAAAAREEPGLASALERFEVFPEESLVGRLQAGQLDAGFFYSNEAREAGIPTVPLAPVHASATFTVTTLRGGPDPRGAEAFVAFLLGPAGRAMLTRHGLTVLPATLTGSPAAPPARVRLALGAR